MTELCPATSCSRALLGAFFATVATLFAFFALFSALFIALALLTLAGVFAAAFSFSGLKTGNCGEGGNSDDSDHFFHTIFLTPIF